MAKITVKIAKKKDGDKGVKIKSSQPSFADKIKPLTQEQIDKGKKINELAKKKPLFKDGNKSVKKSGDTYTREITTTQQVNPEKNKLYIKEGTVQRRPIGKGVDFIPKEELIMGEAQPTKKITDPKSGKTETEDQEMLRQYAIDAHQGVDLENRYKEGDYVTYGTKKGQQVAGKVYNKVIPPEYSTETKKQIQLSRKGGTIPYLTGTKEQQMARAKELEAQGYSNQAGTGAYIKPEDYKWVDEADAGNYESEGYFRSDRAKEELDTKKKGAKKMKIYKKGSKRC